MLRQNSRSKCEGARSPFQIIAQEGAGKIGKYLLIVIIYFQLLGAGVVFLLLTAQNMQSLLHALHVHVSFCLWILIVTAILIPFCWFGTPKDSWILAVIAMVCTAIAALFISISALRDHKHHEPPSPVTFKTFSFSMGIMFFSWGGSAMFPTIQVDMKHPDKFHYAVIVAYIVLLIFYLPIQIIGYTVYGSHIKDNILEILPKDFFRYSVEILITGHLLMAFTIVLNPVFQGLEDVFKTPKRFCWQRVAVRSILVLFLTFLAETIPHFGPILSFIGSSTVSLLGFVLPVICYVSIKIRSTQLVYEHRLNTLRRVFPIYELILLVLSLMIGLFGAFASSIASFSDLVNPKSYVLPCFINATWAEGTPHNDTNY
ncbi:unnamed protein product [Didymodactylos carnosus]|uniref:Amino acid transporter transmembrane domain-containing protein n=1 Tax=Didymodactylos carnosus TaxID=1234261 RepID=A0A814CC17_9BILA|nr:unnamed protein product [Didymodactylos carnosus]CAF3718713.1 unnamed protein product [Didymodactylos carnosus]